MRIGIDGPAGRLQVDDSGDGIPVIACHSLGGNLHQWTTVLGSRPGRRLVAFDMRGHGGSGAKPGAGWSADEMAADLLAVLDARGIDRAIFAGHSLGAWVATAAAVQAPARCAGLFLVDPGSDPSAFPLEQAQAFLAAMSGDAYPQLIEQMWGQLVAGATPETRDGVLGSLRATPKETVLGGLGSLHTFRALEVLRQFDGPVFVLAGPIGAAPDAVQNVLGLQHRVLENVSHWLQLDAPDACNEALDAFVAGLPERLTA